MDVEVTQAGDRGNLTAEILLCKCFKFKPETETDHEIKSVMCILFPFLKKI